MWVSVDTIDWCHEFTESQAEREREMRREGGRRSAADAVCLVANINPSLHGQHPIIPFAT